MRLTRDTVTALIRPPGKADHIEWDDALPGFGVRLRGEAKRWIVQYRVGPQQRRESLGDVRKVNLEDARRIARQRFAQAELGTDPAAERAKARRLAAASKLTLAVVSERYLAAKVAMLRRRTYGQAKLHFSVHWKPLRDQPIDGIKRAEVAARLHEIVEKHGRTAAARARCNLSALFTWAMKEGLCESNPVIATNDPALGIPSRDRVLSDAEIRAIWTACQDDDFGRIVRLLLLTGCRREEIGGLKWVEIDFDTGILTVPGERTKNHKTLTLALPGVAVGILQAAPKRTDRDYVFGIRGGAFSAWSYSTMALNNRIVGAAGKPLPRWTLHDARRTVRTGLGRLGVPPHVAELVLNHVRGGVQAIYDRHRYAAEIKDALARWAEHIASVIEIDRSNVIGMPAHRGG